MQASKLPVFIALCCFSFAEAKTPGEIKTWFAEEKKYVDENVAKFQGFIAQRKAASKMELMGKVLDFEERIRTGPRKCIYFENLLGIHKTLAATPTLHTICDTVPSMEKLLNAQKSIKFMGTELPKLDSTCSPMTTLLSCQQLIRLFQTGLALAHTTTNIQVANVEADMQQCADDELNGLNDDRDKLLQDYQNCAKKR